MTVVRLRFYLLLGCLLPGITLAGEMTECLEYGAMYRGLFSLGTDMRIADVVLETRPPDAERIGETRLEATSAAYPVVESLYPLRFRFRTWMDTDDVLVAFETYEKTNRLRHRLYLRDASEPGVRRLDLTRQGVGTREIRQLEAGRLPPHIEHTRSGLLDRLGLLQRVRGLPLQAGAEYRFEVTTGNRRFDYTVQVEKAVVLRLGNDDIPAWKVRFDGSRTKADGRVVKAHRPLYVWLSRAPGHIPLRVDSRHAIGLFRLELKDTRCLQQLAGLSRQLPVLPTGINNPWTSYDLNKGVPATKGIDSHLPPNPLISCHLPPISLSWCPTKPDVAGNGIMPDPPVEVSNDARQTLVSSCSFDAIAGIHPGVSVYLCGPGFG